MDQWNRAESLKINPHIYDQLTFNKGDKNIQERKNSLFSKWYWENWTAAYKSMKLENCLTLYTRVNSKWLKDLNMRQDAMKLLEENVGKTFWHKSLQCFLRSVFQGNRNKSKNKQVGLKLISFCTVNESINKMKRQPTDWEKIFANDETDIGLLSKVYKYLMQPKNCKTNNPIKKWAGDLDVSAQKTYRWSTGTWKHTQHR